MVKNRYDNKMRNMATNAVHHTVAIIAMIAIAIAVTNHLVTVTSNATSSSKKPRRSFLEETRSELVLGKRD